MSTPISKELLKDIKEQYARELHYSSWRSMCEAVNIVPRDVSAIAERYAAARVESLERWKREADALLAPLLDYGQSKEANIDLGKSVTAVILQRAKWFEVAKKALEDIASGKVLPQLIAQQTLASWKEDGKAPEKKYPIGGYAPGNYYGKCCECGKEFQGDKRAIECEPCAVKAKEAFDALSPNEQAELISRNAELAREFFSKQATKGKQEGGGHE